LNEVSVVIVTYNSVDVVSNSIRSVVDDTAVKQCFIVDNSSSDDIVALVDSIGSPKTVLIQNAENYGFGVANNIALDQVTTPYSLLLNPDAEMDKGAVAILLDAAKRYPNAAILTPLLYGADGEVQECYRRDIFNRDVDAGLFYEPDGDMCADFLIGAVMLLNMEIMRRIGFFDSKIFLFYEDDDICKKVKKNNHELVLIPTARAFHAYGGSSGSSNAISLIKLYHMEWSRLFLYEKYIGKLSAKFKACWLVTVSIMRILKFFVSQNSIELRAAYARLCGRFDYLIGRRR
jgi:N-acetylglucosaminyl-diphospho-decaprenol L-rhamnosyltransferase